jgi:magnesium-protoporphyrin O-methyltransferase
MVREQRLQDATLLDVGGGIGVLAHEFLDDGVRSAVLVDGSTAYLTVASEEAASRGTNERLRVLHGDFVEVARDLDAAAVVTLDRVVCCYPDYRALLAAAAAKSHGLLAISYPRDRWFVRLVMGVENLARRLARNAFRTYVHPPQEMDRVLEEAGYRPVRTHEGFVWRVALFAWAGESV